MSKNMTDNGVTALVVGATGLVGEALLRQLSADPETGRIVVLARRPPEAPLADAVTYYPIDFDHLDGAPDEAFAVDEVYCALGTTRKKAGSAVRFRQIDYGYPMAIARQTAAQRFGLVSALGAKPESRFLYNRVKGELERDLAGLGFARLVLVRPSFLLGPRREVRWGERIGNRLFQWAPARIRSIHAAQVAHAMHAAMRRGGGPVDIIDNRRMHRDPPAQLRH